MSVIKKAMGVVQTLLGMGDDDKPEPEAPRPLPEPEKVTAMPVPDDDATRRRRQQQIVQAKGTGRVNTVLTSGLGGTGGTARKPLGRA